MTVARNRTRGQAGQHARARWLPRLVVVLTAMGLIGFVLLSDILGDDGVSPDSIAPVSPSVSNMSAVVAADGLNVRDGASLDAAVIDTLPRGAMLEVLGSTQSGFTPVGYGTGQAWMATEFLDFEGSPGMLVSLLPEGAQAEAVREEPAGRPEVSDTRAGSEAVSPEPARSGTDSGIVEPVGPGVPVLEPRVAEEPVAESLAVESEPAAEPEPAVAPQERWIEVDRSTAVVALHEGETIVATYQGKVGKDDSADGFFSTAVGTFHVFSMSKELTETPFAEGVYLSDWVGFDPERSNGFHSPVRDEWGNVQPVQNATTLGCVRLEADAAVAAFDFSHIGMRVEIHD